MTPPSKSPSKSPQDLESLVSLAKGFADRDLFDEAIDLFEMALRFEPDNLGLKLSLAQVKYQQRRQRGSYGRDGEEALREQLRRNAIDCAHFFGLAALYEERGKQELAVECLTIARRKEPINPYVYKLSGKLQLRRRQFAEARDELRTARRYNPFDREIAELLGHCELELGNQTSALEATIDAFLLLREDDQESARRLKESIQSIKKQLGLESHQLVVLFRDRREKLQTDFERLELQRERLLRGDDPPTGERPQDTQNGRIELAARLRQFDLWKRLDDEQIFQLTQVAHPEVFEAGAKVFAYGTPGADLYVLEKGTISVRRPTSYGSYELGTLGPGAVFGEVNFISRNERSADILAKETSHLVRLDADQLEVLINQHPGLGVQVYLSFWHGLSRKLRGANEQLRTFFEDEMGSQRLREMKQKGAGDDSEVTKGASEATLVLLREQGLSGSELTTLANFSQVKRYPGGTSIFHEGDEGHEMFVVLEGKVMISKFIPGGGEEALAILGRGDFFGEMALIDGQPRSADAKTFQGPVTLVVFSDQTLREVLAMESRAALDFMALLCRLIAKRLREIDEKVTGWRIMSGVRPDEGDLTILSQSA